MKNFLMTAKLTVMSLGFVVGLARMCKSGAKVGKTMNHVENVQGVRKLNTDLYESNAEYVKYLKTMDNSVKIGEMYGDVNQLDTLYVKSAKTKKND